MDGLNVPTRLRNFAFNSDKSTIDGIWSEVYTELKRLAKYHLNNERPNHTLSPTEIVHEVYFRLREQYSLEVNDRIHFMSIASTMIHRVLVNYAKSRNRKKRGEGKAMSLEEVKPNTLLQFDENQVDVIALEVALKKLEKHDARKAKIVELHFYGGLTFEEIADFLNISQRQVMRDWRFARTWLYKQLNRGKTE